jgi:homoserine O-acetyltransferase/O-succinyltransferase
VQAALSAIQARVLLMPSETHLYFPVADCVLELSSLSSGRLFPVPSIWGHVAVAPSSKPAEKSFIKAAVNKSRELMLGKAGETEWG